jgi:hypothetical protein
MILAEILISSPLTLPRSHVLLAKIQVLVPKSLTVDGMGSNASTKKLWQRARKSRVLTQAFMERKTADV